MFGSMNTNVLDELQVKADCLRGVHVFHEKCVSHEDVVCGDKSVPFGWCCKCYVCGSEWDDDDDISKITSLTMEEWKAKPYEAF